MTETERLEEKERLIQDDLNSIANKVRHAFNQGYELGLKQKQRQSKWDRVTMKMFGVIDEPVLECHWCKGMVDCKYTYFKFCPYCGSQMMEVEND